MEIVKSSQQSMKESNQNIVFSLIHEIDSISRADIKKITKLSATTVSTLVDELISMGYVIEDGIKDTSTSGRKAISLSVNPTGGHFVVVTVSANHFTIRTYNLTFEMLTYDRTRYDRNESLSKQLIEFINISLKSIKTCGNLMGITVGLPAAIDNDYNVLYSTVISLTKGDFIYPSLISAFPETKVVLCNTSALIAYAEKEFGETDAQNLIVVDIGEGVGAAIIADGTPYTGSKGMAGEFGHMSIDIMGEKCSCGGRGCLETLISIPAILKRCEAITNSELMVSDIAKLYGENAKISEIIDNVSKTLAFGINNLINIIDPDTVVICGELKALENEILPQVIRYLKELSLFERNIAVSFSKIDAETEFKGGAKYIFDWLFK